MRASICAVCAVWAGCASAGDDDGAVQAARLTAAASFGSNPGNLKMFSYVPPGLAAGAPLVVAMHGCTETAALYAAETGWNALADRYRFAVVYPQQQAANNLSLCFNWFQAGDASRGRGEAASIAQMADAMIAQLGSDRSRVFATGMSAGGFMTEEMMAAYPDKIAAGAVNSGGPFGCATSVLAATACQEGLVAHSPAAWGNLVRQAFPGFAGAYPRLIAFHGNVDLTVSPTNLQQSIDQWSNVLGVDEAAADVEVFRTASRQVLRDASGRAMIETYLVAGMDHALTVDPGSAVDQGGEVGPFAEDHLIFSSFYAAQFFGLTE